LLKQLLRLKLPPMRRNVLTIRKPDSAEIEKPRAHAQRKCVRYPIMVPIVYFWKDALGARRQGDGATRDISAGGIYVVSNESPEKGAAIRFEVSLPALHSSGHPLRMRAAGEVVRLDTAEDVSMGEAVAPGFAIRSKRFILRNGYCNYAEPHLAVD
jgi:hypothetical protein